MGRRNARSVHRTLDEVAVRQALLEMLDPQVGASNTLRRGNFGTVMS